MLSMNKMRNIMMLSCYLPTKVLQSLIPWAMQRHMGKRVGTVTIPMLGRFTVSWDSGIGRQAGHFLSEALASGMCEI